MKPPAGPRVEPVAVAAFSFAYVLTMTPADKISGAQLLIFFCFFHLFFLLFLQVTGAVAKPREAKRRPPDLGESQFAPAMEVRAPLDAPLRGKQRGEPLLPDLKELQRRPEAAATGSVLLDKSQLAHDVPQELVEDLRTADARMVAKVLRSEWLGG